MVTSGTGKRAQTGHTLWGKTGTTDNNGDAWFCGATAKITACVWVGYPDSVTPMETEFAGAPVDGGTFPAEIFAQVVNAYDELEAARKAGEDTSSDSSSATTTVAPTTAAPTTTSAAPAHDAPTTHPRRRRRRRRAPRRVAGPAEPRRRAPAPCPRG